MITIKIRILPPWDKSCIFLVKLGTESLTTLLRATTAELLLQKTPAEQESVKSYREL